LEIRKSPRSSAPTPPLLQPRPPHHDQAEVAAALAALTDNEIKRLIAFAHLRIVGISGRNGDTDAEDLFGEAALLTFNMKRKWRRGITLFNHLAATMRSIGDHRFERARRYVPISDSQPAPIIAQSAIDAENYIASLEEALEEDSIALEVLETMGCRIPARDAQKQLRISAEVYWAARKRIRRRIEALRENNAHA
jgi:hypothetical protein